MEANLNFDSGEHKYEVPVKRIDDEIALKKFQSSAVAMDLAMFIVETQKAVKSSKQTETELPPHIKPLYDYIEKIQNMLDECPPIDQPMRFGNKAFKNWLDKVISNVDSDLSIIAAGGNPDFKNFDKAIPEIREYLIESFGSYERIEAGLAHNVMRDLTGAPSFDIDIEQYGKDKLWERLLISDQKQYVIAASVGSTEASG